jgi:hypothetical protein
MKLYVFVIIFIMVFIFNDISTPPEPFTMENIGPFNPDGGDRGVYVDRSGLKPRMFRIFPDIPKEEVKLGSNSSDVVSEKETKIYETTNDGFYSQ